MSAAAETIPAPAHCSLIDHLEMLSETKDYARRTRAIPLLLRPGTVIPAGRQSAEKPRISAPAPAHDIPRRLAAKAGRAAIVEVDGMLVHAEVAVTAARGVAADFDQHFTRTAAGSPGGGDRAQSEAGDNRRLRTRCSSAGRRSRV
jgi:hypothetical protein